MTTEVRMHARAARRLAETALHAVREAESRVREGHAADVAVKRFLHRHRELGGRDRRFIAGLVFSCFRWLGWTHRVFEENLPASCFLSWQMDADAPHSAAAALAEMAGIAPSTMPPLGGSPINEKLRTLKKVVPGNIALSTADLVPSWLSDVLYTPPGIQGPAHFHRYVESCQVRPPTWLRLVAGHEDACLDELAQLGIEVKHHATLHSALRVTGVFPAGRSHAARRGEIEIQDLAPQCVGLLCAPQPGESWWDLCAGSGGKSLHLADLMQNQGHITGTDIRPGILRQFALRVRRTRFTCISVEQIADRDERAHPPFDGALVDAPCSGLGTWSRNPDARRRTPPDAPGRYAETQFALLDRAAIAIRPGGRLVYSVCTVTRQETVGVMERFLAHHPEFHPEIIRHPLSGQDIDGYLFIWPWEGPCDGMFIACLRKAD